MSETTGPMTDVETLAARLRAIREFAPEASAVCTEAADQLLALQAQLTSVAADSRRTLIVRAEQAEARADRVAREAAQLRDALRLTGSPLPDGSLCWCPLIVDMADEHEAYCAKARELVAETSPAPGEG